MKSDLKSSRWIFLFSSILMMSIYLNSLYAHGDTTIITKEELEELPVQRNLADVLNLVPGVNAIGNQTLVNGSSTYDNTFMIDGVVINDPLQSDQFMNFPFDVIEEIQIQTGGLNAEYGQARGSVINVVTKSGNNKFSGSASLYHSPDALGADLPNGIETPGYHFRSSSEYGFTLGGPIIKDKLWFFGSAAVNQKTTQLPYPNYPPQDHMDFSPYLRFDFNPDSTNQFQLSYNYAHNRYEEEQTSSDYQYSQTDVLPRHMVSGSWHRNCLDGWETDFQTSYTQFGRQYDEDYMPTGSGTLHGYGYSKEKSAKSFGANFDAMAPPFFCGSCSHQLGMGIGYQATCLSKTTESFHQQSYTYPGPGYQYTEIWENSEKMDHQAHITDWSLYVQDTWKPFNQLTVNAGTRFDRKTFSWSGDSTGNQEIKDKNVFSWEVFSPRFSLTYDITGDGKNVAKLSAGRYYQSGQYGWFEEASPAGTTYSERNVVKKNGETTHDTTTTHFDPPSSSVGYDGHDLKAPYMDEIMLGVERQMSEDWSLGLSYSKRWERNLIQTVDASRLDMNALINNNKLEWIDYQPVVIASPYDGQSMTVYEDVNPFRMSEYIIVNPPGAERNYDAIELILNKYYSHGWSMNASYTYSNSRGLVSTTDYTENYGLSDLYQNPNAQINAEGLFDYAFQHQIKVHGMVDGPYGIRFGGSARIFSGNPYTHELSSDYPPLNAIPDGFGTIYAEERGASQLPTFWMLNLGLEKTLKVSDTITTTFFVDGYNITNNEIELKVNPIIGSSTEGELERILNPGLFQFGVRVDF